MNKRMLFFWMLCLLTVLTGCTQQDDEASIEIPTKKSELQSTAVQPEVVTVKNEAPNETTENVANNNTVVKKPTSGITEESLVAFNGVVEHIFFHPLIAFPELAFDGDYQEQGYNDYFTTVSEFKRIIDELYARDYILVNLSDVYEQDPTNPQTVTKKTFMLPVGKKPIVISIDDLNYYQYMLQNGNVYKLVLDEQGKIATFSIDGQGKQIISYDNEIVPILDRFVEEHPDFSLNGAKGTIALTGYEGVLGYRTQIDAENRQSEIVQAKKVIAELKSSGWIFASHSYGHISVAKSSLKTLQTDTERWEAEVATLVGETALYVYPYGARPAHQSDNFNYLVASGYKVLSAVGPTSHMEIVGDAYTMDRRHMDGIAFIQQPQTLSDLFDVESVLDKQSRPTKYLE